MRVVVDSMAWLDKAALTITQVSALKAELTLYPTGNSMYPSAEPEKALILYEEREGQLGVPRGFFAEKSSGRHEIDDHTVRGGGDASNLIFDGSLRSEQTRAVETITGLFTGGTLGGILRAPCGFGKTVVACAIAARMRVPTLVVVHKEFLMTQWRERIGQFLPRARIGLVQQDVCDYQDRDIVLAMVHSLAAKKYPLGFYLWPGLVVTDEVHRISATTWSPVPTLFPARWRLGISATPRRKDGTEKVFFYQIGKQFFAATEKRMLPKVRKVFTTFNLVKTPKFNPSLAPKSLILKFLCISPVRNQLIVDQLLLALATGRKVLVLSERLAHLKAMEDTLRDTWVSKANGMYPTVGYYVGGMSEDELDVAGRCQVIFATSQYAQEGLDLPALDTLFLTTPLSDVEQAVGRILRPCDGKKDPIVVDFRDDKIPLFHRLGEARDRIYARLT